MELVNKIALITGGASGMGAATARLLTTAGMKVAILDQHLENTELLAKEIKSLAIYADVTDEDSIKTALAEVVAKLGAVHVVINCAGIAPAARIVGRAGPMSLTDFQQVLQVNLVGTFNVMRLVAAQMMQQSPINTEGERGVIINTASIAAFEGQVGQAAYSASKGGIVAMTLPAAREFGPFGVRVMTVAPGVIATPMMEKMPSTVCENLSATVPFPKRMGNAEEFAQLVKHIIENTYLNGSTIRLDGGLRMR